MRIPDGLALALACASACGPTTAEEQCSSGVGSDCDPAFDSCLQSGAEIWAQRFEARDPAPGSAVVVDAAGLVYAVAQVSTGANLREGWLAAFAADGGTRWETGNAAEGGGWATFNDVALTPSGDVVVVGLEETAGEKRVFAVAFAAGGELQWRSPIALEMGEANLDTPPAIAIGHDGRIVVAVSTSADGERRVPVFAELGGSGELLRRWEPPADGYTWLAINDVELDDAGGLYVVASGARPDVVQVDEWLGRWDATGSFLGPIVHEGSEARAVAIHPRGGAFVLASTYVSGIEPFATRPVLRRYDASGAEAWSVRVDFDDDQTLGAVALTADCDGRALVLGWSAPSSWLFVFDEGGDELERRNLDRDDVGQWVRLATDPFGNPVFAGGSYDPPLSPLTVAKIAR